MTLFNKPMKLVANTIKTSFNPFDTKWGWVLTVVAIISSPQSDSKL